MIKKLFTFWKQKEKPKIHWWSVIEGLEKVAPIVPAKEYVPDWWKKVERMIDNKLDNKGTVRNCPSFPEYITQGFVVPLWCDLHLEVHHDSWKWKSPEKLFTFNNHPGEQFRDWLPKHVQDNTSMVLKPNCPWRVKTPPGWSVWQLPMIYHYNPVFETLPGIIWSDIHHEINQQMMFHKKGVFNLQRGTPLAQYIPIRRETFEYNVGNETPELRVHRNASYYHVRTKFGGGYPQHRKEEIKKGECPYHATSK